MAKNPLGAVALTAEDYRNLVALVSRASYNGIGEAAAGVQLMQKLQTLANLTGAPQPPSNEEVKNDGDDSPDGNQ